jgi:hypothetical protein
MPRESLERPEDLPKQALRQVALGQLKYLLKIGLLYFDGQPDRSRLAKPRKGNDQAQ